MTESASLFERVKQKLVRLLPDSIFGQILFVLVAGLALLQIANFLVVCGVQKLYVDQMERARIEHVVSYRALFESIPADLRAETLNAAQGNPALAQSLERVTIVRERPDHGGGGGAHGRHLAHDPLSRRGGRPSDGLVATILRLS